MAERDGPVDVSTELKALRHEKKNQKMRSLPANMTIQRRPLYHPPTASQYAGEGVQKVVYVSKHTPIMSAVKRVKKLLTQIEKRALQSAGATSKGTTKTIADLVEISERLRRANEEVLVKASGRAMSQALRVAEWFRNKERDISCNVEVRTSSVQAVDDIVEEVCGSEDDSADDASPGNDEADLLEVNEDSTMLTGGETTLELLKDNRLEHEIENVAGKDGKDLPTDPLEKTVPRKRKRSRRRRPMYDKDDIPEARIRWVKIVEVAISLKA